MSEEFKATRITLSEEARERLEKIMKSASFRSNSAAIEECIRVVWDIMKDIWTVSGESNAPNKEYTRDQAVLAFETITTRMTRFTGIRVIRRVGK